MIHSHYQTLLSFLLVVVLKFHTTHSQSHPPPLHLKTEGKIYYVETFFKANWYRANEFCRFHGMELATVSNRNESDLLIETLQSLNLPNDPDFWVSGNDLARQGSYVWAGVGQRFTFRNFYPGLPDNLKWYNGEDEHCIELRGEFGYQWNDLPCSLEIYFICEKEDWTIYQ